MVTLRVLRKSQGWNVGDLIEAPGNRAAELVTFGEAEIIENTEEILEMQKETKIVSIPLEQIETEEEKKKREKREWYDAHFGKYKKQKGKEVSL